MNFQRVIFLTVLLGHVWLAAGAAFAENVPNAPWPPAGKMVRMQVARDTWLSSVGAEGVGNNGGAERLKLKGQQEYSLVDIDTSSLKGKIIVGALLHMRSDSPDKAPLARVGISTLASEWVEGTSSGYRPRTGASCFVQAAYQQADWAYPGSTLMNVVFGNGHTRWKFADAASPDKDGWQACAVDPDVVAARIAGISHGFCLYDEVGSTWSIENGDFKSEIFPNRFFYSRESGKSAPWLEVWIAGEDRIAPEPVSSIRCKTEGMPQGQALVEWVTPEDKGGGKTLGFFVRYALGEQWRDVPRYLIPMAGKAGDTIRMYFRDLGLTSGQQIKLSVRPVDSAGNIGEAYVQNLTVSSGTEFPDVSKVTPPVAHERANSLEVRGLKVLVLDSLEKRDPVTGEVIPAAGGQRHLFSPVEKRIMLYSGRNETISFQLNLEGHAEDITVDMDFDSRKIRTRVYQFGYVALKDGKGRVRWLPDPLVLSEEKISIPSFIGKGPVPWQKNHSLICELYIPHDETVGKKRGKIRIGVGKETLTLDMDLTVWNFTLPDKLSFIPEMNSYSGEPAGQVMKYYRLAHENRTCLNRLPYGWSGKPSPAPEWDGAKFDWAIWEKGVASLLDGSAFSDLPRNREPVDVFYLPFNENWPVQLSGHYTPSYWADEALSESYRMELKHAFSEFAGRCRDKGWRDTIFQFYLNNKVYYREKDKTSSAPWVFDEPVNTQDFWALRWCGLAWQEAVAPFKDQAKLWFRGDISYSQFERNMLWGITDIEYLGGNTAQKTRMQQERKNLSGESNFAEYGSANKIDESNVQSALWCISAWAKGAMGVLPWQTIGSGKCWEVGEQTALFYPGSDGPAPSVRLKAFTYGQQLVEYLTLFSQIYHVPRYLIAEWLEREIGLRDEVHKESDSDAGTAKFQQADLAKLWRVRYILGEMISKKAPLYKRALVDYQSFRFAPESLPDIGYVFPAPGVEPLRPVVH